MQNNKVYVMVGIPASGKSSIAKKVAEDNNAVILSSDAIRAELYGDESVQGDPAEVFGLLYRRAYENLVMNKNVIIDATNVSCKTRRNIMNKFRNLDVKFIAVYCDISLDEALKRNSERSRNVPYFVIQRMYNQLVEPSYDEGFDNIIIYNMKG